ncbi:hypothetical protein VPHD480_0399 [Vibrio phage D480]
MLILAAFSLKSNTFFKFLSSNQEFVLLSLDSMKYILQENKAKSTSIFNFFYD